MNNNELPQFFDGDYYENGVGSGKSLYSNYRWMPELTIPMCHEIIWKMKIDHDATVLDFGCAKGYLVKGMRLLNRKAFGVDISKYAISEADLEVENMVAAIIPGEEIKVGELSEFDYVIAKDVLEHIPHDSLDQQLKVLRKAAKRMLVVVPLGDGEKYYIPSYEQDKSHFIREDLDWWQNKFEDAGFNIKEATYDTGYLKTNWKQWEKGNGLYVLD
jgi:SAM-dependent methyltransferase